MCNDFDEMFIAADCASALEHFLPLVQSVIEQAERRVIKGEQLAAAGKVLSIFEPHADCVEMEDYKFRFAGEGATEWEYGPLTADDFGLYRMMHQGYPGYFILCPGGAAPEEGEPAAEGEIDYPPPVTEGAPVAGMLGLGLVAAACALGTAVTLRKK